MLHENDYLLLQVQIFLLNIYYYRLYTTLLLFFRRMIIHGWLLSVETLQEGLSLSCVTYSSYHFMCLNQAPAV